MEKRTHKTRTMRYDNRCKKKEVVQQKSDRAERYEKRCVMKQWDKETEKKVKLEVKADVTSEIQQMLESPKMLTRSQTNSRTFFFD